MTVEEAKKINIRNYLESNNIKPLRTTHNGGLYSSPFREERTPSFYVDYTKNLFHDKGTNKGGSFVDLIMIQHDLSFHEAMKHIENMNFCFTPVVPALPTKPKPSPIVIHSVKNVLNKQLFNYAESRGISAKIIYDYCKEVHYSVGNRSYHAIGFLNDMGGLEFRSAYFKGCTSPKAITTIKNDANTLLIFEGFFDFLSYLQLTASTNKELFHKFDFMVLNSLTFVNKVIEQLSSATQYKEIFCYFDNDRSGIDAYKRFSELITGPVLTNCSTLYHPHNDLNEALINNHFKSNGINSR